MSNIFLTSDLHFNHNKDFIYKARGFNTVEEMNEAIITNWNSLVNNDDEVYVLGDLIMGDLEKGAECLNRLNGNIHVVLGNHDSTPKVNMYRHIRNINSIDLAAIVNYKKYHFFLSHYPSITGDIHHQSLKQMTLNLFGHTHSKDKYYEDPKIYPFMYNVALDANDCKPVLIDDIIENMNEYFLLAKKEQVCDG